MRTEPLEQLRHRLRQVGGKGRRRLFHSRDRLALLALATLAPPPASHVVHVAVVLLLVLVLVMLVELRGGGVEAAVRVDRGGMHQPKDHGQRRLDGGVEIFVVGGKHLWGGAHSDALRRTQMALRGHQLAIGGHQLAIRNHQMAIRGR
jgi:hypothetical protein